jgi:hypothetical protein
MQIEETLARELVAIMKDSGRVLGTGMPDKALLQKFGLDRLSEFKVGLAHALAQRWLSEGPSGFVLLGPEVPKP